MNGHDKNSDLEKKDKFYNEQNYFIIICFINSNLHFINKKMIVMEEKIINYKSSCLILVIN